MWRMKLPVYLEALHLSALPVDYTSDNATFNGFWSAHDESSPRLATAINPINGRAAFALGAACTEWVLARVEGHTDTAEGGFCLRAGGGWGGGLGGCEFSLS